jgi:hypothetical protein
MPLKTILLQVLSSEREVMMTMMMEGFLILITMKMTSVKPLKEKSQKAISVMTIRSSSCSSCPSYPSSSSFLTANSLYNLQTVHGLARHFLEAGEDGGLPLGLDLESIQLEDQYQNTEYGPEPIENAIPTTGFNFNEVDDTDMDMEPPSPPMQTMGPPPRPIQMEDESEFIAHMHFHDPNMSQLEMALGIFADNTGMSRTEWAALRQILTLVDHPMIQRLPHSLTTLKRHLSRELPLLRLIRCGDVGVG